MQPTWSDATISGVVGLVFGEVATVVVSLLVPSTREHRKEMLIAAGCASFCAAFAGYLAGARRAQAH